ncbi:MAG: adenylate/guanylate cyclase domain-containing protein [Rhodospirillales bacterium]
MVERRLTAILCADVVGWSRLMGADEEGTLGRLKALRRAVVDPAVARHGGRIVKTTGDGLLAEFASAVAAVRCAVEVQRDMAAHGGPVAFRIGVNLGDVIHDKGDVFGDGVNVAARLEGLAPPGGVCVARTVFEEVRDKLALDHEFLGEQTVKNIARPVAAYRIAAAADYAGDAPPPRPRRRAWIAAGALAALGLVAAGMLLLLGPAERAAVGTPPPAAVAAAPAAYLSVAVLPFANLSGEPDEYFVDGITEDLITDLSRISGAFVTARNSAFAYKGKAVDVRAVGRELGVRYVLEGSVRRAAERVRVTAQLVDAEIGTHVWADRFDVAAADAYALQDDVTGRIARALNVELKESVSRRAARGRPDDLDAAILATHGWAILFNKPQTPETNREAEPILERAIALDPRNAEAWTGLSYMHSRDSLYRWSASREESTRLAVEAGERAVALDPRSADAHYVYGFAVRQTGDNERARAIFERCVELNPNYAPAYFWLGFIEIFDGEPARALPLIDRAFRLSPRDGLAAVWYYSKAYAHILLGDDAAAVEAARAGIAENPKVPTNWWALAAASAHLGRPAEAREALATYTTLAVGATSIRAWRTTGSPTSNPRFLKLRERAEDGLRKAGMPEE